MDGVVFIRDVGWPHRSVESWTKKINFTMKQGDEALQKSNSLREIRVFASKNILNALSLPKCAPRNK